MLLRTQTIYINKNSTIKNIPSKSVLFQKADKSNTSAILNKEDYNNRMTELFSTKQYMEIKEDLPREVHQRSQRHHQHHPYDYDKARKTICKVK